MILGMAIKNGLFAFICQARRAFWTLYTNKKPDKILAIDFYLYLDIFRRKYKSRHHGVCGVLGNCQRADAWSHSREPVMSTDSREADRELMLAPLRVHGNLSVSHRQSPDAWIDATLGLQLDAESPHLDFVGQTLKIIGRITEHSGVVLSGILVEKLESIARHARAVMEAYELASTTREPTNHQRC